MLLNEVEIKSKFFIFFRWILRYLAVKLFLLWICEVRWKNLQLDYSIGKNFKLNQGIVGG